MAALLLSSLASAQEPAADDDAWTFSETLEVRVIEVEVVVTDQEGNRVPGLRQEDFRLRVEGEALEPDYFSEYREASVGAVRDDGAAEGTHYLVFIDDYFTDRRYRKALFDRMVRDLAQLGRRDRMAIVRYFGRDLQLLSGWTESVSTLRGVLVEASRQQTYEKVLENRIRSAGRSNFSRVRSEEVAKVTTAVTASLRSFSEVPGRKVLLLLSSGWPTTSSRRLPGGNELETAVRPGSSLVRPIVDTANLLGYTIYPLHLGLIDGGQSRANAANRSPGTTTFASRALGTVTLESLRYLAESTGGLLFTYAPAVRTPLAQVVRDTRSYYSLGFSPKLRQSGRDYRIEVEVLRPGLEVRHRGSFRDLTRRQQVSMAAEAALLLGAGGPGLEVKLGQLRRAGIGTRRLPVEVRIPMDWATMIPQGSQYVGRLELRVAAVDARGDRSEMPIIPIPLRGPRPAPGSSSFFEATLEVRPKKQRLVVSLHDILSGDSLTTTLNLDEKGRLLD